MRVPIRRQPETRIGEQQQAFARPVQPLDVSPLTHVIEAARDHILDGQEARQRIDLNRRLITEVNDLQTDFADRQRNPEIPAEGFTKETDTAYNDRHAALVGELRQQHYSPELLADFDNRLATVRQSFHERGLVHQYTQLRSRASEEIEDTALQASQYAASDPVHNYATARDTVRNSIRSHPDLMEDERATLEDQQLAVVRDGASRAYAIQHPDEVINLLDPQGLTAPYPTTPQAPGSGAPVSGTRDGNPARVPRGQRAVALEGNNPGGLNDGPFARSQPGYVGNNGRYAAFNTVQDGVNAQKALLRSYVSRGHDTPLEIARRWAPAGDGHNDPTVYAQNIARTMGIGINDRVNEEQINRFAEAQAHQENHNFRASADHPPVEAPAFRPAPTQVASAAPRFIDQPPVQGGEPAPAEAAPTHDIASVHTGNALIDDMNGPERMQLLGRAREQLTRVQASQRAEMDVRLSNIRAEYMANGGESATPMPTEQEVLQAYPGPEGPQRWAQLQETQRVGRAIVTFRTQSAESIQHTLDNLRPHAGSPTYATELEVYNAAQQAAQALLTQRQQDPATYAAQHFPAVRQAAQSGNTARYYAELDRAYRTLGIDPRTAPVMTTEQTQQFALNYRSMTAQQRGQFIQRNMEEMGEDRFRRLTLSMEGTTIATDARIYALIRSYPGLAQNQILFNQILEGRETIAQDPARRPRESEITKVFRLVGNQALRDLDGQTSRAMQEAAEALYIHRGGDPAVIDRSIYRQALTDVLGGSMPVNMGRGRATDYTILPAHVTEQQFRSWMEHQTVWSLTRFSREQHAPLWGDGRTPVPIQTIIDEGVFVMTSPGWYMIRMASDGRPLMAPSGNPFLMRISPNGLMNIRPAPRTQEQIWNGGRMGGGVM